MKKLSVKIIIVKDGRKGNKQRELKRKAGKDADSIPVVIKGKVEKLQAKFKFINYSYLYI